MIGLFELIIILLIVGIVIGAVLGFIIAARHFARKREKNQHGAREK